MLVLLCMQRCDFVVWHVILNVSPGVYYLSVILLCRMPFNHNQYVSDLNICTCFGEHVNMTIIY